MTDANITIAKPSEQIFIRSMGKSFRVQAVATTEDAANAYCSKHDSAAVIACMGPLIFIANKYDGRRDSSRRAHFGQAGCLRVSTARDRKLKTRWQSGQ